MRVGVTTVRPRIFYYSFLWFFLFASAAVSVGLGAESTPAPESKESFNLILPFKDLTVGQGQEVTMDAEVVNRRRFPV